MKCLQDLHSKSMKNSVNSHTIVSLANFTPPVKAGLSLNVICGATKLTPITEDKNR